MFNDREKTNIFDKFSKLGYPPSVIPEAHRRAQMKFFIRHVQPDPTDYRPTVRLLLNRFIKDYMELTSNSLRTRTASSSSHKISSVLVRRQSLMGNLNCGV